MDEFEDLEIEDVVIILTLVGIHKLCELKSNDAKRRKKIITYPKELNQFEFEYIVKKIINNFKRGRVLSINNGDVQVSIQSVSGKTTWQCHIDFNDYGKITGKYWIYSDNDDSSIPKHMAEAVIKEIEIFTKSYKTRIAVKTLNDLNDYYFSSKRINVKYINGLNEQMFKDIIISQLYRYSEVKGYLIENGVVFLQIKYENKPSIPCYIDFNSNGYITGNYTTYNYKRFLVIDDIADSIKKIILQQMKNNSKISNKREQKNDEHPLAFKILVIILIVYILSLLFSS